MRMRGLVAEAVEDMGRLLVRQFLIGLHLDKKSPLDHLNLRESSNFFGLLQLRILLECKLQDMRLFRSTARRAVRRLPGYPSPLTPFCEMSDAEP